MLIRLFVLLSAAANAVLFVLLRRMTRAKQRIRLAPVAYSRWDGADRHLIVKAEQGTTTVVMVGDSRAEAWRLPAIAKAVVLNRGISGESTQQVWLRFKRDVLGLKPDMIVLQVGVNDLWRLGMFDSAEKQAILHTAKQTITNIVNAATAAGATVILTTIFPLGRLPLRERLFGSSQTPVAIAEINQALRQLQGPQVILFETAPILCEPDSNSVAAHFLTDYLHLNNAGYAALNTALVPLLQSHLLLQRQKQGQA